MLRTTALSAAAQLGVALLAPTSAGAAGETCQGVPATHVGGAGSQDLTGTEGPDVIVTNGSAEVRALGGDDVVYITDVASRVDAGAGDDVVHALVEGLFGSHVQLGSGSDRFTGTSAVEAATSSTEDPGTASTATTSGPDSLIGGRGCDVAIGSAGRDVCSAERTRTREVRR